MIPFEHPDLKHKSIFFVTVDSVNMRHLNEIKQQAKANGFHGFCYHFAGDPTSHPDILTVLSDIRSDKDTVQIVCLVTDMHQGACWWCSFIDATEGLHRIDIVTGWQRDYTLDLDKDRKKFADKITILMAHRINVYVDVVISSEIWDEMFVDANFFYDHGLNIALVRKSGESYTQDQIMLLTTAFPHRRSEAQLPRS